MIYKDDTKIVKKCLGMAMISILAEQGLYQEILSSQKVTAQSDLNSLLLAGLLTNQHDKIRKYFVQFIYFICEHFKQHGYFITLMMQNLPQTSNTWVSSEFFDLLCKLLDDYFIYIKDNQNRMGKH